MTSHCESHWFRLSVIMSQFVQAKHQGSQEMLELWIMLLIPIGCRLVCLSEVAFSLAHADALRVKACGWASKPNSATE